MRIFIAPSPSLIGNVALYPFAGAMGSFTPTERDVALYRDWLRGHPKDMEVKLHLERARNAATIREGFADHERRAHALADRLQLARELDAVAARIRHAVDGAGELVLDGREVRLGLDDAVRVEHVLLLAVVLQELHLLHARLEALRIAVQIEQPFVDVVVIDLLVRGDLVEHSLAVLRESQLDQCVLGGALGVALAQELQSPERHARRLQGIDAQCRVLDGQ